MVHLTDHLSTFKENAIPRISNYPNLGATSRLKHMK